MLSARRCFPTAVEDQESCACVTFQAVLVQWNVIIVAYVSVCILPSCLPLSVGRASRGGGVELPLLLLRRE